MDAPSLVSAWDAVVQQLCYVFTEPTARTWRQIALGWVLNRGPATVTGIFRTLGDQADRHWTVYEKFFYRAAWDLSDLCTSLLQKVIYPLLLEAAREQAGEITADLAIDDTTAGRSGKHVAHAGWFKDASATGPSHRGTVIHWAHNWLVGGQSRCDCLPGLCSVGSFRQCLSSTANGTTAIGITPFVPARNWPDR